MKNVLVHLHPDKEFDWERATLARIQIDNSLRLGWNRDDILFVTNFDYLYNGVKATVVPEGSFCSFRPRSTNTITVPVLFELGLISAGEWYWVHDFDAYQNHRFNELGIRRELSGVDVGLTTYGWSSKWCLGSFFFNSDSRPFFEKIRDRVYEYETEDERALISLTKQGFYSDKYRVLNITYNFGMRNVEHNYEVADKPVKVLHFHPHYREGSLRPLQCFMYGKNGMGLRLMSEGLINIFNKHGIK